MLMSGIKALFLLRSIWLNSIRIGTDVEEWRSKEEDNANGGCR